MPGPVRSLPGAFNPVFEKTTHQQLSAFFSILIGKT
jgi:hypothetical protein